MAYWPRFSPQELQKFAMVFCKSEASAVGTSTLISTEEADFYGGGIFLRRRHISTEEAGFYGGGIFLRRKLISMEEAYFYGGG